MQLIRYLQDINDADESSQYFINQILYNEKFRVRGPVLQFFAHQWFGWSSFKSSYRFRADRLALIYSAASERSTTSLASIQCLGGIFYSSYDYAFATIR